jgi:hypothetical protein
VVANWPALKASHAWFNLFGFVSLVIAGSLLHLLPTVAGARIGRSRASVITFAALASGPPLTAIALGLNLQLIATVGVAVTLGGGIALVIHAMDVLRRTAKWTTDLDWHHFTTWSLMASCGWFVVAVAVAAIPIISGDPWQLLPLMVPFGVGWVLQALVGSWSHLMPAVGPGSPARHGRQRRILGFAGSIRVLAFNAGVAVAVLGIGLGVPALTSIGGVAIVALLALALVLLAFALVARE